MTEDVGIRTNQWVGHWAEKMKKEGGRESDLRNGGRVPLCVQDWRTLWGWGTWSLSVGWGHLQLCQPRVIKIQKGHTSHKTNGRTVTLTL